MDSKRRRTWVPGWLASMWLASACVCAQAADSPPRAEGENVPVAVDVVTGARIVQSPKKNYYPFNVIADGREGWVVLIVMIDAQGKPYEPTVAESSGHPAFEKAALQMLDDIVFAPATRGAVPIDSRFKFKIKFAMKTPAKSASSGFATAYRKLLKALDARDKPAAEAQLALLVPKNLYEDAFTNMGRFNYHLAWGTPAQQRIALEKAIAGERQPAYLPRDMFISALLTLFRLEVDAADYGEALDTWEVLEPFVKGEMRQNVQGVVDQIQKLVAGDKPLRMAGFIDEREEWGTQLLRNRFSVDVTQGSVRSVRLLCAQKFLSFPYETGLEYSVDSVKGLCRVRLVGDAGTTFFFNQ